MKKITVKQGQYWSKESNQINPHSKKQKDRIYSVVEIFRDEIDTVAVMRDFDSQRVIAEDVSTLKSNPFWKHHPNATVTEEIKVERHLDLGEDLYTRDKPKKKSEPKEAVKVSLDISKTVKEITGNRDTQIAKALNSAVEESDKKSGKKVPTDQESWERFAGYMYEDLGTFGDVFKDTEILTDPNFRGRWMNGKYALQGEQCLDMYRDEGVTIRRILSKQLVETYKGSGAYKPLSYQTIIKRLFKAIWKHGKPEERKLLFGDLYKEGK